MGADAGGHDSEVVATEGEDDGEVGGGGGGERAEDGLEAAGAADVVGGGDGLLCGQGYLPRGNGDG